MGCGFSTLYCIACFAGIVVDSCASCLCSVVSHTLAQALSLHNIPTFPFRVIATTTYFPRSLHQGVSIFPSRTAMILRSVAVVAGLAVVYKTFSLALGWRRNIDAAKRSGIPYVISRE